MEDLQEFIIIGAQSTSTSVNNPCAILWDRNQTLSLIDGFKKYRNKVGTLELRSMKRMWELIANDINQIHTTQFNGSHCENRWRVIDRNYKKYIDDSNKTGRGRKFFEFSKEMDEIFGKKRNINPELLLSNESTLESTQDQMNIQDVGKENQFEQVAPQEGETMEKIEQTSPATSSFTPRKRRRSKLVTRNNVLEQIRLDKKQFYDQLLNQKRENVEFLKQKFEINQKLKEKRIEELHRQNDLLQNRNEILQKYLEMKVSLPTDIV